MEGMIRWIEAMHLEAHIGPGDLIEQPLQALDVGRLLRRMDEALIPDPARHAEPPSGGNTLAHEPPPTIHWSSLSALRIVAAHERCVPRSAGLARPGLRHAGRSGVDDDARHGHPAKSRAVPGPGLARARHRHLRFR